MKTYKNHEGYRDPTAGEAISRMKKKRKHIKPEYRLTYRLEEKLKNLIYK